MERQAERMLRQVEALTRLVGESKGPIATRFSESREQVKISNLTDNDGIASYLETFEQIMVAYDTAPAL